MEFRRLRRVALTVRRGPASRFVLVALRLAHARSPHTAAEMSCLRRHAEGRTRLVELGVEQGAGTVVLREAMSPSGVLYAVDPHPPGRLGISFPRLIARAELARVRKGNLRWLRMTDVDAVSVIAAEHPEGLDVVYSDCPRDYEGHLNAWSAWSGLLRPGGVYILATSRPFAARVPVDGDAVRAIADVIERDPDFSRVDGVDTFSVFERRS